MQKHDFQVQSGCQRTWTNRRVRQVHKWTNLAGFAHQGDYLFKLLTILKCSWKIPFKEKVWQALPQKVSTRAGVDLDTDKIQLVWDMCRWEIQIQIKMFRWTISSKGDKWTPNVSTRDVNKIILKIRAGLGSIEELTLVRPFHSGWPGHLQLQVLKMHLSSLMISLTSLIMSLFRQDLFFYYLRGYAFDITAQQTQVLVDWLNLFFGRLRSKYMRYLWLWDFIDVRKDNTTLQPYW